ncbi:MAG: UDP-N-acetylmuramoyl-L-alanine--D-glutamate ligase [Verrucomicrobiae bacterium]|nr:UDP-N-acetylmuramoyl-L-alanine--D-glutamate ligase [Verrucomicrobiae bacterium]
MIHSGQRIAILGAGTSGIAAARLAVATGAAWVGVYDSGDPAKLGPSIQKLSGEGIEVVAGDAALHAPDGLDVVVVSPGIDTRWPIAKAFAATGAPLIGEIEFAWRQCRCPVIAITGTNGKTTTTELTAAVLTAAGLKTVAAGNYGVAFSEVMLSGESFDMVTLEVSSFQLETIETFKPKVAVWMNFAPDHMDRYDSVEDYLGAKLRVFQNQGAEDFAVVNAAEVPDGIRSQMVSFSAFGTPADYELANGWICHQGTPILDFRSARLKGRHNAENIMAAIGAAHCLGVSFDQVVGAVSAYTPPRHRCEPVGEVDGKVFINDSKATNIHALASSLRGQEEPVVLIVGGKNKGLDYSEMIPSLAEKVTRAVCMGEIGSQIADLWRGEVPCEVAVSMDEAVRLAATAATPGQTILFSPGTSSFDMYSGYAERGDAFKSAVERLAAG